MPRPLPLVGLLGAVLAAPAVAAGAAPAATGPTPRPTAAGQTAPVPATPAPLRATAPGAYLVTLRARPAVDVPAARTSSGRRARFDARSSVARAYAEGQRASQRAVAGRHRVQIHQQFTAATNGFSARLTTEQVRALRADPEVAQVWQVQRRRPHVYRTPDTLRLTGAGGVWSAVTTTGQPLDAAKGVVVGVLDTGVWPENPAFTGAALASAPGAVGSAWSTDGGATTHVAKAGGGTFTGSCTGRTAGQPVEAWAPALCNHKLVSARAFATASPDYTKVPSTSPGAPDYWSPRDNDGHGSHTASTAAGLRVAGGMTAGGTTYPDAGGIAPGASLAAYKVCWDFAGIDDDNDGRPDNYCMDDSVVAAVDQAVTDGVDVLNFSVSGASGTVLDPVSRAFLRADQAGVSVVAAAGNSGPSAGTVNHVAPWVTTVAAAGYLSPYGVRDFSSRGPADLDEGAVLKPDLAAPGVDILAATTPPTWSRAAADQTYEFMSGTSMATPHVAGLTALLRARHAGDARWTTSAVRSALMTTAIPTSTPSPFAQGAGYVSPGPALDPGLLLDVPSTAMMGYAQREGMSTGSPAVDPVDLNLPSIAVPRQGGPVTVRRTFTATRTGQWSVTGTMPGYAVTTSGPLTATSVGQQLTLAVTLRPAGAAPGQWSAGTITLTPGSGPALHLPVVSRPGFTQPGDLHGAGRNGQVPMRIAGPTSGRYTPAVGLALDVPTSSSVVQDGVVAGPSFSVPTGAQALRVDLTGPATDDLDLRLQQRTATGAWIDTATSMSASSRERADLTSPAPGTYRWVVEGYAVTAATSAFRVDRYVVTPASSDRVTVNPRTSYLVGGQESTPWVVWTHLDAGHTYLAWVRYPTSTRATTVRITA